MGPTLVAMAMKFGIGTEIQSPTSLLFNRSVFSRVNRTVPKSKLLGSAVAVLSTGLLVLKPTADEFFYCNQFNLGYTGLAVLFTNQVKNCKLFFVPGLTQISSISTGSKTMEQLVWNGGPQRLSQSRAMFTLCLPAMWHLAISVLHRFCKEVTWE